MARLITISLLLLCLEWSNPALYRPNTAGIKLDVPPGLEDVPVPKQENNAPDLRPPPIEPKNPRDNPKDVPYSSNEGTAPRSAYIPPPGRPPRLSSTGIQRPPESAPYITGGYVDAESQPGAYPNPQLGNRPADPRIASQGADSRARGGQGSPIYNKEVQPQVPGAYSSPPQSQPPPGYKQPSHSPASQNNPSYPFPGAGANSNPAQGHGNSPVKGQPYSQTKPTNPYQNKPATPQQYPTQYPQAKPFSTPNQSAFPDPRKPAGQYTPPNTGNLGQLPSDPKSQTSSLPGGSKPAFPSPFQFPDNLKVGQNSPFNNLISFNSPRPFKSRAPVDFPGKDDALSSFPDGLDNYKNQRPEPPSRPSRQPPIASQSSYPSYSAPANVPAQNPSVYPQQNAVLAQNPSAYPQQNAVLAQNPSAYPQQNAVLAQNPSAYPQQNAVLPGYGTRGGNPTGYYGYNNNAPVGGGQCFQYTYVAEAYRLSDIAKNYPEDAIQKELDKKPYLAPLVGLQASETKKQEFSPFGFSNGNSFQFDYSGFGFQKDQESPADKYNYLLNNKAYPSNYKEGDFAGGYPSNMRPLDTSCPSQQYKLRSFFFHGGECHVVNPEFQQVTYYRCSRRECNFCGVNRGLSACVEDYRWLTVLAYCEKLTEFSRITPLRLILPTGCTCQHFPC